MTEFNDRTEATLWFIVYAGLTRQGAGNACAAPKADEALVAWRERNPHRYEVVEQLAGVDEARP